METTFIVGASEHADYYCDLAKEGVSQLSRIALDLLATDRKSCVVGRLAAELHITRQVLESTDNLKLRRILKLLKDLERLCAWPKLPSVRMVIIEHLVTHGDNRAETRVKRGILSFANSSQNVIESFFKNLSHFSKESLAEDDIKSGITEADAYTTDEYPARVNAELYTILKSHSLCTCNPSHPSGRARHHARLKLQDGKEKHDEPDERDRQGEHVTFDMLFSESPETCQHWQDLQVLVSLRKKGTKAVKFKEVVTSSDHQAMKIMQVVKPNEFCKLISTKLGCRIRCHVRDSELHRKLQGYQMEQDVDPGESLSLRELLNVGRLSNRMKLVLAYIIARSFWQYYDSPWMNSPWTSDSIHFLRGPRSKEDSKFRGALRASEPYFAVEFQEIEPDFTEDCDAAGVIFPYPRLLSLCTILLEIEQGQSESIEENDSMVANLNHRWHHAKRLANMKQNRNDFDFPHYRKAIVKCLQTSSWEQKSKSVATGVLVRKAGIRDIIVRPLEKLLEGLGFSEDLHDMGPVDEINGPSPTSIIPEAPAVSETIPNTSCDVIQSEQWLDKIKAINQRFAEEESFKSLQAPRIAILDTGYDGDSDFFNAAVRRRRLKGWKDFVESSENPIDEAGHGTHMVATAMKAAPLASVYVARIAKNIDDLRVSSQAIVEAINWAANDKKVDIISMSFGFQREVPIINDAIRTAVDHRKRKLIFLAAASNSGGNSREMFPANLSDVVSIRATSSRGTVLESNPPVRRDEAVAFGTLGHMVSSAWLSKVDGEVAKSGSSVATAVAAGIAALLMTITDVGVAAGNLEAVNASTLRTQRGLCQVWKRMSRDMGSRCRYISPDEIFVERDVKKTWTAIADACTRSG